MKALVGAFNQEKALVGAFSVIVQPVVEPMEHYTALTLSSFLCSWSASSSDITSARETGAATNQETVLVSQWPIGGQYCATLTWVGRGCHAPGRHARPAPGWLGLLWLHLHLRHADENRVGLICSVITGIVMCFSEIWTVKSEISD